MTLGHPAALWLLLLGVIFVVLSLWRRRPRAQAVGSLYLWERIPARPPSAHERGRPRLGWLFLLQVATLAAVVVAIADPAVHRRLPAGPVVVIVDNTARMNLKDSQGTTRWERLRERIGEETAAWPPDRAVYVAWMGATGPHVERREATNLLDGIAPAAAMFPDWELPAAAGTVASRDAKRLWASDRPPPEGMADAWIVEAPPALNAAITGLRVEPGATYAVVETFGEDVVSAWLHWEWDGQTRRDGPLDLVAGARVVSGPAPTRGLTARLEVADAWDGDNGASAVRGERGPLRVRLDGAPNAYLQRALDAVPGVEWARGGQGDLTILLLAVEEPRWRPVEMAWASHPATEGLPDDELGVPLAREVEGEPLLLADGRTIVAIDGREVRVGAELAPDPGRPSWVASPSFPIFWTRLMAYVRTELELPAPWEVRLPPAGASDPGPARSERGGLISSEPVEERRPVAAAWIAAAIAGVLLLAWAWRREV